MSQLSLAVDLAGLRLRNPTLNAAGVLGISSPLLRRVYEAGAGAVVTKSIGPRPRAGHPNPTVSAVECGLLNAMGLPNPGAGYFAEEIRKLKDVGVPVVASFFGESVEAFAETAMVLAEAGADALELNCSCPNVEEEMGMLGADPAGVERVTAAVKGAVDPPVFVKLTPNVADIAEVARAAEQGGADAVTAVNTLLALAVDADLRRPVLANVTGGLSGPALKPVALRCVWEVAEAVDIPVIGCGGVSGWRDAVEFLLCGASAVEVGTALMTKGLDVFRDIPEGIRGYMEEQGFGEVGEIVGLAHEG
ncbi:dihydroorotate dehydrogenase [miscellaneous Crenarchaeota group-15 archaeon DG-45]|uniref:Dihydroorotate dehydrogenase n=1 Tax=miscellaneous Crenarchaeota group-15 archaeon DG-45 TaxID=1685127 RepID=A0A0M0BLE6_9ARCH|nr:MAG: dihydroorotate dehydrogenase [miscellaneous Crenarchaeota group-15 archaeon DG-45]